MMTAPADILLNAIRDPQNPRLCGSCLIGCLAKVFPDSQRLSCSLKRRSGSILERHHDIWNALILFITTRRTKEQTQHLLERLGGQCHCRTRELHKAGNTLRQARVLGRSIVGVKVVVRGTDLSISAPPATALGSCFVIEVFVLLSEALPGVSLRSLGKNSASWPTTPTELLPLGADAFVTALLQWHGVLNDSIVFTVCGLAWRLCCDLLLPSMISHSFCDHLVMAWRRLFDKSMVHLTAKHHSTRERDAARVFSLQLYSIDSFILEILRKKSNHVVPLVRGYETKLCQLFSLLLHVVTDPRFPEARAEIGHFQSIAFCGQHLYRLFLMHLPPRPPIPLHPAVVDIDKRRFPPDDSMFYRTPAEALMHITQYFKAELRCFGLNCSDSLQTVGRSIQRCGRCNVVAYCGRECQAQDWRDEKFPHKKLCPILRKLLANGAVRPCYTPTPVSSWTAPPGVSDSDADYLCAWVNDRARRDGQLKRCDGTEQWTPGFDDYENVVWQFGASGKGPKPCYPDRLARWPYEVAKVKALLADLPFWEHDIV